MFKNQNLPQNIRDQIEAFRAEARAGVEILDAQLFRKTQELNALESNVCQEDAAALIESDIKSSLSSSRASLQKTATQAKYLWRHERIATLSINTRGDLSESTRHDFGSLMLPYNLQPIDVLALTWSDAEIKAYALSAATAAGAKTIANGGLKVAQALEQHEILAEEIRVLINSRKSAVDSLAGLIDIALQPFTEEKTPAEPPTPSPEPSVMVQGADGVMRPYLANEPFGGR